MQKLIELKMTLEMADPTDASHFMYLIREADKRLELDTDWYMERKITPRQLKMWRSGMTPSIQERLTVYKELSKEVNKRVEASNSSSERPQDEEGETSSAGSARLDEGDSGSEPEQGPIKAAS